MSNGEKCAEGTAKMCMVNLLIIAHKSASAMIGGFIAKFVTLPNTTKCKKIE
jgi:hypothetical protein